MKPSMVTLALALSGTALAIPFSSSSSRSGIPRPSQTSVNVPSSTPFTPSNISSSLPSGTPWIIPVIGGQPVESSSVKRADVPIPTELSSLEANAESALGALPYPARNRRSFSVTPLPSPTASPSSVPLSVSTSL